jgi:outer membrane receptor protein involved in Fe transport
MAHWWLVLPLLFPSFAVQDQGEGAQTGGQPHQIRLPGTTITVSAAPGLVESAVQAAPSSAAAEGVSTTDRPLTVLGNALAGEPSILAQQSTAAQSAPFLRGLTGYQVLNLVDGVRLNNSTYRSGPNQYLAYIDSSQVRQIEAVLGPATSVYGSDAMGGTLQVLTPEARFSSTSRIDLHGDARVFGGSASTSGGGQFRFMAGNAKAALLAGASLRRDNDIRAGGSTDSRHALRRFFGFDGDQIRQVTGERQRNTAFSQTSAHTKLTFRPSASDSITAWYQFGEQSGVNSTKDLWGGLGRVLSTFEPQRLHFGYLRWERLESFGLDRVSATYSVNHQTDGGARQGLLSTGPITTDLNRVGAHGISGQATKSWSPHGTLVAGADTFRETIGSTRTLAFVAARPLYPDQSNYSLSGAFAHAAQSFAASRLRAAGGLRWSRAGFNSPSQPAFGSAASAQTFNDLTMNGSLSYRIATGLKVHALSGRGFRAPNLNDLGAIGLNDLGYEIPASEAAGALIGSSAGETALSTGKPVNSLLPERVWNYEAGATLSGSRHHLRLQAFRANLLDPIVRRTMLFPSTAVPASLAGLAVTPIAPSAAQLAQGVITVATALDARAVKAFVNDGRSRYSGVEARLEFSPIRAWTIDASYSFLAGADLDPTRNIRRLPPQGGFAALRWNPGRRAWFEMRADASGAQSRLSGGDMDDERIGASRSRNDITSFWNGTRAAALRTSDGRLALTGETLPQLLGRVLPLSVAGSNSTRVALYSATAGWVDIGMRGGFSIGSRWTLELGLSNLLDKNYRVHGSGIDSPGIHTWSAIRFNF